MENKQTIDEHKTTINFAHPRRQTEMPCDETTSFASIMQRKKVPKLPKGATFHIHATKLETPLQLSGFLTGDTIKVRGDTGNLKFSVQFSVQEKQTPDHENRSILNSLDANACFPENHSGASSSFSSYKTPNDVQEIEDHGNEGTQSCETRKSGESHIVTRLRSGVISRPATYFPRISMSSSRSLIRRCGKERPRKKKFDVFERVLRRHSCPIRPCTNAFFVMAAWGLAKSSSFGETSRQLGRMWCQLPRNEKKLYEKMAMKDNARYERQCSQLMGKPLGPVPKGSR